METETTKTAGVAVQETAQTSKVEAPVATDVKPVAQEEKSNETTKTAQAKMETAKVEAGKTYTEADLKKILDETKATVKGGYEGAIKKVQEEARAAKQERLALAQQLEDAKNAAYLSQIEQAGIPNGVELAKQLISQRQAHIQRELQLQEREERLIALQTELNQAAMGKAAFDTAKEYGLSEDEAVKLSSAQSKPEMVAIAATIALTKLKAEKKAPDKPAGDGGTGRSGQDFTKLSDYEKLRLVLEHKV